VKLEPHFGIGKDNKPFNPYPECIMEQPCLNQSAQISCIYLDLPARTARIKIPGGEKAFLIASMPFVTMADYLSFPMLGLYGEDPFWSEQNMIDIPL
jgi:hypothetical protein